MQAMTVITQIVEAKGRGQRRRIYLDGKFAFTLKLNVVARFRLREGMTVMASPTPPPFHISTYDVDRDRLRTWAARADALGVGDEFRRALNQIFDGLIQFDVNLKPIPALAEFWEGARDGRTWTFTLRQEVKFHNGREVTAQGRSRAFVNGSLATAGALKELSSRLIELHGQHEHQTLLAESRPAPASHGSAFECLTPIS